MSVWEREEAGPADSDGRSEKPSVSQDRKWEDPSQQILGEALQTEERARARVLRQQRARSGNLQIPWLRI